MINLKMKINKKLLPIKGHYFFFNAGTAPLVPYLSTYARQLGFSSATVGLIYTVLPIFGLIAKPLFGVIADRFKKQKSIFILFQIVTIVSFSAIYAIPESRSNVTVKLDCGDHVTVLKSCYNTVASLESDEGKINSIASQSKLATCQMNCDMSSPKTWQTVCEHWHIPQYCYSNTNNIKYTSSISKVTVNANDSCTYVATSNVTLDGLNFVPHCRIGNGFVDINEPCTLDCTNQKLAAKIGKEKPIMTCVDKMLNYKVCLNDTDLQDFVNETHFDACSASCDLDETAPWRLMEICEGWGADVAASCQPKTMIGQDFPSNLSFTGTILLNTTIPEANCVYAQLNHIQLPDESTHYPNCMPGELFHTSCDITCNNTELNEIFAAANESENNQGTKYTKQFWLFFMLMIISWIGQAVVVTFADAICFNLLGDKISHYGKQRLWGSVGWGIFSLMTGALIDVFSDGAYKDYTVAFILMFVFMTGDVIVSYFLKVESTKMSMNILADVGTLLSSVHTVVFMLWTIAVGLCTGLLWQFLFWYLEDLAAMTSDGSAYIKTLQGLVSAIQTFGGEIPFLFISGYILRKLGHVNMMTLVLFAFGIRFILYSFLTNAWWVLPIELFQGITFGMFYPTMTSYANVVSPPGTETTVQGLVGAVFEGVGTSLGSFIGGRLYETYGGKNTFQWFGISSLVFGVIHMAVQYVMRHRPGHVGFRQDYTSVIRYEQPNDMIHILEDMSQNR
ncbi:major facilitator superfamily domain-containing protein 6 [Ostrinia nubilalis]|uniref:major facilitator superfamily domain-containing protein 6 n=1 Tax=Ostrinia nubilalis TaxID=29057 RepID=UPI00308238A9